MNSIGKKVGVTLAVTGLVAILAGKPHIETKFEFQSPNPVSFNYTGKKISQGIMNVYKTDGSMMKEEVFFDETKPNKPTSHWEDKQDQFIIYGKSFNIGTPQRTAYDLSEKPVLSGTLGKNDSIKDETGRIWNLVGLGHDFIGYK